MPNRYMDLPGQEPISETYQNIEAGFDAVQGDVDAAVGISEGIQAEVTEHKDSTAAHAAEHIAYSGTVAGVTNLKDAVDNVQEQFNTVVVTGDSSPAADQARISSTGTTYPSLKSRLDTERDGLAAQLADTATKEQLAATNANLSQKANKSEVRLSSMKIELEDASPELLAAIEGGEGTTFNLLSIPQDKSVSYEKTTFLGTSKNLIDKDAGIKDHIALAATGEIIVIAGFYLFDKIPVDQNTVYTVHYKRSIVFYDSNKQYISGIPVSEGGTEGSVFTFTSPPNTKYLSTTAAYAELDTQQLEKGNSFTGYEPYKLILSERVDATSLKNEVVGVRHLGFLEKGKNLMDKNTAIKDHIAVAGTGEIIALEGYYLFDKVPVEPHTTYTVRHKRSIVFYDTNKQYISGIPFSQGGVEGAVFTFTTPANTRYLSTTASYAEMDTQQLENGSSFTGYEPYGNFIPDSLLLPLVTKIEEFENGVTAKTLKVLSIGNSFSEDAQRYIHHIANSAKVNVIFGNLYMANQTLEGHWNQITEGLSNYVYYKRTALDGIATMVTVNNVTCDYGILDEVWDIVTLQQGSALSGLYDTTFQPYLNNIISHVKSVASNSGVKIAWHQTWAYSSTSSHEGFANYNGDQMVMFEAIVDASKKAFKYADIDILIPCGTAIQNARAVADLKSVDSELTSDGHHLGDTGAFIAGITFYQTLISGLYNKEIVSHVAYTPISKWLTYLSKLTVKGAYLKPFVITELD